MKKFERIVLSFDLDFTLIDNREGIINSFNYALEKYRLPKASKDWIEKMIGTPLDTMFAEISELEPLLLTSAFREYYGTKGIYQVKLFSGVREMLEEFKNRFTLGVITSKKQEMAVKLLRYLEIDEYFDFILGETKKRKSKTDPKLREYLFNSFPNHNFVVIGDHPNDRALAEMLVCPFIGLLSGNHSADQLKKSGTSKTVILHSIKEITTEMIYALFE